jgi:hypothetical protein
MESGVNAIAYETVTTADGKLPLLTPMSIIAGRLSVQFGARYLEKQQGGRGVLLGRHSLAFLPVQSSFLAAAWLELKPPKWPSAWGLRCKLSTSV